jgi:hypothetical protein
MGFELQPSIIFAVTIIFNLGGFFFVAKGWKKSVNGHFEKIDEQMTAMRGDLQEAWKEIESIKGYMKGISCQFKDPD